MEVQVAWREMERQREMDEEIEATKTRTATASKLVVVEGGAAFVQRELGKKM